MADPNKLPARTVVGHVLPAGEPHSIVTRGLAALQNPDRKPTSLLSETQLRNLFIEYCDRGAYGEALQLILALPDQTCAFVEELFEELGWRASPEPRDVFGGEDDEEEFYNEEWPLMLDEALKVIAVLRSAAQRGHPVAQEVLGRELTRQSSTWGRDADESAEGIKWMREAAENGRKRSQETLGFIYAGTLYRDHNLVPLNYAAALTWLRKAAAQNCSTRAQFTLGQLYYEGLGTAQDYGQASRWFRKAAAASDDRVFAIDAQLQLACIYCNGGEGLARDRVQAFMWLAIAETVSGAHIVDREGNDMRHRLSMELTSAEVAEAQQRAKTWLESHGLAHQAPFIDGRGRHGWRGMPTQLNE
jgi:TPR repeat protein